ncbi:MAG: carbon-nitrogen hydrolase family protein [Parvibaculaceae bacterium]
MRHRIKAACIQNCATPDVQENIAVCMRLVQEAAAAGATLIALPEYFSGLHTEGFRIIPVAFPEREHPVLPAFAEAARRLKVSILLGSLGVKAADGRTFNRSYLLARDGTVVARYDKIHMFDVDLGEGTVVRESATIAPGGEAVVAEAEGISLGLSICYDLRFAHLYRALAHDGADVLAVPAAFTRITGQAHWHVLNRARAIENGAFVLAPCQFGTLAGGAECYGHSLIIDPWGRVLADGGEEEGFIVAELDLAEVEAARARIPSLTHDRPIAIGAHPAAAE